MSQDVLLPFQIPRRRNIGEIRFIFRIMAVHFLVAWFAIHVFSRGELAPFAAEPTEAGVEFFHAR